MSSKKEEVSDECKTREKNKSLQAFKKTIDNFLNKLNRTKSDASSSSSSSTSSSSNSLPFTDDTPGLSLSLYSCETLNLKAKRHRQAIESSTSFDFLNFDNLFANSKIVNNFDPDTNVLIKSTRFLPKKKLVNLKSRLRDTPQLLYKSTRSYLKSFSKSSHIIHDTIKHVSPKDSVFWTEYQDHNQFLNDNFNNQFITSLIDSTGESSILRALLFDQNRNDQFMSPFISNNFTDENEQDVKDSSFTSTIIHNTCESNESYESNRSCEKESASENQSQDQTFLIHSDESEDEKK
jgi:hypothetical protein